MRHALAITIMIVASPVALLRAETPSTVNFSNSGYSIDLLDPGLTPSGQFTAIQMSLPPKDEFASNVNVQHQAFAGTLNDYAAVSEASMKKMGWTTVSSRVDGEAYLAEAAGKMRGPKGNVELHFYFKAIKSGGNVILATPTTPEARWQTEKDALVPVVESLKPAGK